MEYILELLKESTLLFIQFFGVSIIFSYILTWVTRGIKRVVNTVFGRKGQVFFGGIGIIIHELGHLIFALLFGHKIDKVNLLNISEQEDGSLGSISHSYIKNSVFQNVGHYFIGIAPIFTCTFSILGLYLLMFKESIPLLLENIKALMIEQDMVFFLKDVLVSLGAVEYTFIKTTIFVLIMTNIVVGGFDLSKSDFKAIYKGIVPIFIVTILITFLLQFFLKELVLTNIIISLNVAIGIVLGTSLVLAIITLIVVKVLYTALYRR